MAQPPLTFLERKWATGNFAVGTNRLIEAAVQNADRKQVQYLDYDFHRNISGYGRRTLLSLGRRLYNNSPVIQGVIDEIARNAVSTYLPQFYGEDREWGNAAEDWMHEHDKICDVAGWPYNRQTWLRLMVASCLYDGEMGTLLVKNADGYPQLQIVPSHRIGSRIMPGTVTVEKGEFEGARVVDGVIVNDSGAAIGYRILTGESPFNFSEFKDVPARDFMLHFVPRYAGQLRGYSPLAASAFDWQDVAETRGFEKLAQKMAASRVFIEETVTGEPPESALSLLGTENDGSDVKGTATGGAFEYYEGGLTTYYKAGTGSKLQAVTADRPTMNQREFEANIVRSALYSLGWSVDFALTPGNVGGASMRVVVEQINNTLEEIRGILVRPACARFDGYRVSSAIQLGLLKDSPEWFKWDYQGPAEITADQGYQSDVSIAELRANLTTPQREAARRGQYWQDNIEQAIQAEKYFQKRCKEEGVDPNRIVLLTPNGNPVSGQTGERVSAESNPAKQP